MTAQTTTRPARAGRWVAVLVLVLGTIAALWAVGGGIGRGVAAHAATSLEASADADGVRALAIDGSRGDIEIVFGDVDEAQLQVESTGPVQDWRLSRDGDTLVLDSDESWGWWGATDWGFGHGEQRATLTLPRALEDAQLDLDAEISAGSLTATADFGDAVVELSAGGIDLGGSAASLDADISAGELRLHELRDAATVQLRVSAGAVTGELAGAQPDSIVGNVSAGSIELIVPDGAYDVTEQVSAGEADVRVDEESGAASTIDLTISAGSVQIVGSDR